MDRCEHEYEGNTRKECPREAVFTFYNESKEKEVKLCIFHYPLEEKNGKVDDFWKSFDELLYDVEKALNSGFAEVILDCEGFFFPKTEKKFLEKDFPFPINFQNAIFFGEAFFFGSSFKEVVNFEGAEFRSHAIFHSGEFEGTINFSNAEFSKEKGVTFSRSKFKRPPKFHKTKFLGSLLFDSVTIEDNNNDDWSPFYGWFPDFKMNTVDFRGAKFGGFTTFFDSEFNTGIEFGGANFKEKSSFIRVRFFKGGDFSGSRFFNGVFFLMQLIPEKC